MDRRKFLKYTGLVAVTAIIGVPEVKKKRDFVVSMDVASMYPYQADMTALSTMKPLPDGMFEITAIQQKIGGAMKVPSRLLNV